MMTESGGNPNIGDSAAGAQGIMQFMPGTAAAYGVNPSDPTSSINGAAQYMKDLLGMFNGNYQQAVAAYNWGQGNVMNAINKYGSNWLSYAPEETQNYVKKVLG